MSSDFRKLSKQAFLFLGDLGFHLVEEKAGTLKYKSGHSFVDVTWEARSGELDAYIGPLPRVAVPQDAYSMLYVLGLAGFSEPECRPHMVMAEDRLEPFIVALADNVRQYAWAGLAGDRVYFRRLEAYRSEKARIDMRAMKLRQVRSQAEIAWHARHFAKVVKLYTSVESDLAESEIRMLEFARRQLLG